MYVRSILLDRFGGHSAVHLPDLVNGLNVIVGSAGSGKTTLIDFLRAMWHGFDHGLRQRYLPVDSRGFGGQLVVQTDDGKQVIGRYDDGSLEGRLTVEHDDGSVIGRRQVRDLLGGLTQDLFERAFAVDFQRRPRLSELLEACRELDCDRLEKQRTSDRVRENERRIAEMRSRLGAIPTLEGTHETLVRRRQALLQELESRTATSAGGSGHSVLQLDGLRQQLRRLEQQEAAAQTALVARDNEWSQLRFRPAPTEAAATDGNLQSRRLARRLRSIESRLARWSRTLRELEAARDQATDRIGAESRVENCPAGAPVTPSQRSLALETRVRMLGNALENLPTLESGYLGSEAHTQVRDTVQALRSELLQLGHDLRTAQSRRRRRRAISARDQLARCAQELRRTRRGLLQKRKSLLNRMALAKSSALSAHCPQCGCPESAHGMGAPDHSSNCRVTMRTEWQAELDDADQARGQARREWERLAAELVQVRGQLRLAEASAAETGSLVERTRAAIAEVERLMRTAKERDEILQTIRRIEQETQQLRRDARDLVSAASRYLLRLSCGKWTSLIATSDHDAWVESAEGLRMPVTDVDPASSDQVYLSVCLAVAETCSRHGNNVPLTLNGAFDHYPSRNVAEATEVLREASVNRQILFLTRHEHVASVARSLNLSVHELSELRTGPVRIAAVSRPEVKVDLSVGATSDDHEYFLTEQDGIEHVPSMDSATATRLTEAGIVRVADLLRASDDQLSSRLNSWGITREMILGWQVLSRLMTRVRGLRPYDARILVACGVSDPDQLRGMNIAELRERVHQLSRSADGRTRLLSGTAEELSRISEWLNLTPSRGRNETRRDERSTGPYDESQRDTARRRKHGRGRRSHDDDLQSRDSDRNEESVPSTFENSPRFNEPVQRSDALSEVWFRERRLVERFAKIGIQTVADLLAADPDAVAARMNLRRVAASTVHRLQQQADLMCRVPQIHRRNLRILAATGAASVAEMAKKVPQEFWRRLQKYGQTHRGRQLLARVEDLTVTEVTAWIQGAQSATSRAAA